MLGLLPTVFLKHFVINTGALSHLCCILISLMDGY